MKLFCAWIMLAATAAWAGVNPQLHEVKRVYILSMSSSLDINMTPLIDVMLVLLIIFIITIPSQTHAVKIDNPLPPPPTQPPIPPRATPRKATPRKARANSSSREIRLREWI